MAFKWDVTTSGRNKSFPTFFFFWKDISSTKSTHSVSSNQFYLIHLYNRCSHAKSRTLLRVINKKLAEGHDFECLKMGGFVSAGCGSGNDAPNILKGVPEGRIVLFLKQRRSHTYSCKCHQCYYYLLFVLCLSFIPSCFSIFSWSFFLHTFFILRISSFFH